MPDGDGSIEEKRVYGDRAGATSVYVASGIGLVAVAVAGDRVGEFSLIRRGTTTDVARIGDGRLAVATTDDVLVGSPHALQSTGFGPATAVGVHDGVVAAGDGRIARYDAPDWHSLATVEGVRAIDGDLLAARTGIHRLDGTHVGLSEARDVAVDDAPLAATADGLFVLGNGWQTALEGSFRTVAGRDGRAHAATATQLYGRSAPTTTWRSVDLPMTGPVVDVAYLDTASGGPDDATVAVTRDGVLAVSVGDGWRHRSLGLPDATAVAPA